MLSHPASSKRIGPGRPEGESLTREHILDAAEIEFGERGFAGASLRRIGQGATVTQALVNYYFGSKAGLFEAVYLRRGSQIAAERAERLSKFAHGTAPSVGEVVEAFLAPAIALRLTPGGRAFLRLQARLHTEPEEFAFRLRRDVYDASTLLYVEVLHTALPHLSRKTLLWRVALTVGAYLYAISGTHRLDEIAGHACDAEDLDELLGQVSAYVIGGLTAPEPNCGVARWVGSRAGGATRPRSSQTRRSLS